MAATSLTIYGLNSQPHTVGPYHDNIKMDSSDFTPRKVLAQNLNALLNSRIGPSNQSELKRKSGVAQSTIGRVIRGEVSATVDTLGQIAKCYGLEPWQLLVAGMDPKNAPVLQMASAEEKALYIRLKEAAAGLAALNKGHDAID